MTAEETRALLDRVERSAAICALPPACPKCNSTRTMHEGIHDASDYWCAKCGHRFAQFALFPLPVASPVTLTLTPTEKPARQASLFSPLTSGQEE